MSDPFRRPPRVDSLNTKIACGEDAECKYCATLRQARELELFDQLPELCSPLTPGVQLVNLSHSNNGQLLYAKLGRQWKRMFEQLPLVGDGLVMTRNEVAILGRRMTFPELAFTAHEIKGASEQGGLWFDFRLLGAARAVHLRGESGHLFGVEFADGAGLPIHRFNLTPSSDLSLFLSWVRLHQGCLGDLDGCAPVGHDDTSPESQALESTGGVDAMVSMLTKCCECRFGVRATVHTGAVVQRVHFVPQSVQAIGDWWFAADETVGLHFCSAKFGAANTSLQRNDSGPRLLLYGPTDSLKPALVLEPGDESQAATWCELLEQCK